jgi:putative two-component system response regulator
VVLAVDDTPANLTVVASTLSDDYQVKLATSGRKALDIALSQPPDLILLDVMMPEMDGYDVCQRLKSNPATRRVPVMFLTAKIEVADEERGFEVGAVDFIHKPISPPILLARVKAQLRLKEFEDSLVDHNSWLLSEVERRIGDLRRMQGASVAVMVSLAEFRDNDTGCHIIRTQKYVDLLANELLRRGTHSPSLDATLIDQMIEMMPLHDIGKIAIPDSILLKPGKLDDVELPLMKTHAERGDAILHHCARSMGETGKYLQVAMRIARHHHERWDGSGYPDRLAGHDIPVEARIAAVADVYDALRARRPYKNPMLHDEAWALMMQGYGTQFDPAILDVWNDLAPEAQAIADEWADMPPTSYEW